MACSGEFIRFGLYRRTEVLTTDRARLVQPTFDE